MVSGPGKNRAAGAGLAQRALRSRVGAGAARAAGGAGGNRGRVSRPGRPAPRARRARARLFELQCEQVPPVGCGPRSLSGSRVAKCRGAPGRVHGWRGRAAGPRAVRKRRPQAPRPSQGKGALGRIATDPAKPSRGGTRNRGGQLCKCGTPCCRSTWRPARARRRRGPRAPGRRAGAGPGSGARAAAVVGLRRPGRKFRGGSAGAMGRAPARPRKVGAGEPRLCMQSAPRCGGAVPRARALGLKQCCAGGGRGGALQEREACHRRRRGGAVGLGPFSSGPQRIAGARVPAAEKVLPESDMAGASAAGGKRERERGGEREGQAKSERPRGRSGGRETGLGAKPPPAQALLQGRGAARGPGARVLQRGTPSLASPDACCGWGCGGASVSLLEASGRYVEPRVRRLVLVSGAAAAGRDLRRSARRRREPRARPRPGREQLLPCGGPGASRPCGPARVVVVGGA